MEVHFTFCDAQCAYFTWSCRPHKSQRQAVICQPWHNLTTINWNATQPLKTQSRNYLITISQLCQSIRQWLTIFRTCCEKLWFTNVASRERFFGEFKLVPSSCGGSVAVSLTVSRSVAQSHNRPLSHRRFPPMPAAPLLSRRQQTAIA